MKAFVLSGTINDYRQWMNPIVRFEERVIPEPQNQELLVKVYACGICGTDVHCTQVNDQGTLLYNGPVTLPVVLGHEFAGEVVAVGKDVRQFKGGEMVVGESLFGCGVCRYCRGGFPNQCSDLQMLGINRDGAFAEYVTIPERHAWDIGCLTETFGSKKRAAENASMIEPLGCAYNALFINGGGVMPGENAIVYGCGPIGLGAIAFLRLAGAGYILAVEPQPERQQLALSCGADMVVNPDRSENQLSDILKQLTGKRNVEIQIDCSGEIGKLMKTVECCMAPGGRFIYVGRSDKQPQVNMDNLVTQAGHIVGSRGHVGNSIFPNLINLLASKRINPDQFITHRYPFHDIADAFNNAGSYKTGKVIIQMDIDHES